jgi:hypothetical protein
MCLDKDSEHGSSKRGNYNGYSENEIRTQKQPPRKRPVRFVKGGCAGSPLRSSANLRLVGDLLIGLSVKIAKPHVELGADRAQHRAFELAEFGWLKSSTARS